MLKKAEVPNTYERAHYLATLALGQHARKHFPELCPTKWPWGSKQVRIEWLNHEMKYNEGDRLPVDHRPGDYIEIVGSVRIGMGDFHKVKVAVDIYPYPGPNKYYQDMEVEVTYLALASAHAQDARSRHYQQNLLPDTSVWQGLVLLV